MVQMVKQKEKTGISEREGEGKLLRKVMDGLIKSIGMNKALATGGTPK